jgi:S-adenosyl-L-methionine hydrolase (adenosine-forming)
MENLDRPGHPIITLSTDFGLADPYVGVMKGVILGINPQVRLVDLTHELSHHRLLEAAFILHSAFPYFPPGTIHLAVVDPGVGGDRRSMAIQDKAGFWIGPDNGLFSLVLKKHPEAKLFHLIHSEYFLERVSGTFHGRDILAPAAAHISRGVSPLEIGEPLSDPVLLDIPEPEIQYNRIRGQVLWMDHFGNLITNICEKTLLPFKPGSGFRVFIESHEIAGIHRSYVQGQPGRLLALIGSGGYLEIACNLGRAADMIGFSPGREIKVEVLISGPFQPSGKYPSPDR